MISKSGRIVGIGIVLSGLSACASYQPVLYPNAHYQSVGRTIADRDIRECRQLAESSGAREGSGSAENTARRTAIERVPVQPVVPWVEPLPVLPGVALWLVLPVVPAGDYYQVCLVPALHGLQQLIRIL